MTETRSSENRWRGRLIRYAPLILWTLLVLSLSSAQASMQETSLIIRPILKFLFPTSPEATIDLIHAYIRKSAHFTEYAILAFFAFRAASGSSFKLLQTYRLAFPLIFVLLIASVDEFHQSFEPSRTSSFWDVLLDCAGGTTMVLVLWLSTGFRSRRGTARPRNRN